MHGEPLRRRELKPGDLFRYKAHPPDLFWVAKAGEAHPPGAFLSLVTELDGAWNDEVELVSASPSPVAPVVKQPWYVALKPEPIEVMEAWTHLPLYRQLALKYLARAGLKGDKEDHIKDLKKCIAYLTRELKFLETGKAEW